MKRPSPGDRNYHFVKTLMFTLVNAGLHWYFRKSTSCPNQSLILWVRYDEPVWGEMPHQLVADSRTLLPESFPCRKPERTKRDRKHFPFIMLSITYAWTVFFLGNPAWLLLINYAVRVWLRVPNT